MEKDVEEFWMAFGFWIFMCVVAVYSIQESVFMSIVCILVGLFIFFGYVKDRDDGDGHISEENTQKGLESVNGICWG